MVVGVVEFLREWSVVSLQRTNILTWFLSYTLHAANLPLPTQGLWRRVGSIDDATSHPFVFLTPANGKPTTTKSPGASQDPGQPSFYEISTERSSIGVSHASRGSPHELLLDEPYTLSEPGNANDGYTLPAVHNLRTGTVPTLGGYPEDSISEVPQRRIDKLAKVTQLVIPRSSSHHASAVGAHGSESKPIEERFP